MRGRAAVVLLMALLAGHDVLAAETVREHPDERLGALVEGVVDVINAGDPERMARFVRERYDPVMMAGTPTSNRHTGQKFRTSRRTSELTVTVAQLVVDPQTQVTATQ